MNDMVRNAVAPGGPTAPDRPEPHPVLARAFRALDHGGVAWALVRGTDDLARPTGDVDLLVDAGSLPLLDGLLATAGLRRLGVRGHGSHRFYFSYDPAADLWIKLDVVTVVAFGRHQQLHSPLAAGCLSRRRREGSLWRLAPADEAWLFLLHLLLDKGHIAPARRDLARAAAGHAPLGTPVARALDEVAGPGSAALVLAAVDGDGVTAGRQLFRNWTRRSPVPVAARYAARRLARRLAVAAPGHPAGLVVAVLGPDGAGKSTLTDAVRSTFPTPAETVYMGLWQESPWDARLRHLPAARLATRIGRALRTSATAHLHRRRRRLVLLDRAPQDALLPGAPTPGRGGRIVSALALRLGPQPDLALVLDAPGAVMFARKGEHSVEVLEARRHDYLALAPAFRHSAVLDATQPADQVRRRALAAIWDALTGPGTAARARGGSQ
ncbi:hypothetical protein [Modestobacter marinus]|uniref:hypothetical protein n=1 Tax=Modestobacter marinus TaxID=477641 RepID=UPI001C93CCD3|nr:hypothetical protein [Modestobacter marinus]